VRSSEALVVGMTPPGKFFSLGVDDRRALLAEIADAGLDGLVYADHVSFRGGAGTDGLALMAGLSQLHPTLELHLGVYLLPLRHPVPVARQIATIAELAPGRLRFGVGIGGEDRQEIASCGVDPRTRGRRCDEALTVLRPLLRGEAVTFSGEFFELDAVRILPAPEPPVPVVVGGRSDAAVRRAGRFGDGWLGTWCSARRFAEVVERCDEVATAAGRGAVDWQHGMQLWVGFDDDRGRAREHVRAAMEGFYKIPFDVFERYTPYGTPADVAEFFVPFLDAGLRHIDLTPCAASDEAAIAGAAEVKRLLGAYLAR
jgi:alkanesulfonate monooxygenase SsuD/methylene tetrahydromethanopterin reductase-like flavin-dependent oxidoreductase (luciferase family)